MDWWQPECLPDQAREDYDYGLWAPQACSDELAHDLLFWDLTAPGNSCKAEDYCDPPMPTDALEEQIEVGILGFKNDLQLLEGVGVLGARAHDISVQQIDLTGEQSIALAVLRASSAVEDDIFAREFDARVEGEWVVLGRGGKLDPQCREQDKASSQVEEKMPPPSSHHHHRPALLRRPSNPPPCTLVDGPTPKNADDADQTCDNRRLFWEMDPNWKSPTTMMPPSLQVVPRPPAAMPAVVTKPVPRPSTFDEKPAAPFDETPALTKPIPLPCAGLTKPAPRPPAFDETAAQSSKVGLTKAMSFKDKKSPGCQLELETERQIELHRLDDDRQTFDNFDRLWEKDPRFVDVTSSGSSSSSRAAAGLEEQVKPVVASEKFLKVEAWDIIQKHTLNVVNAVRSSAAKEEEPQRLCKSKVIYDPITKRDRRFVFELGYEILNQNEAEGTADATIRNVAVVIKTDVHIQVVLKVDPKKESERKFLYCFTHNVKVISDFKLESEAHMQHMSDVLVSSTVPEAFHESGIDVLHHKVLHFIAIYHSWAAASTPRGKPGSSIHHSLSTSARLEQQQQDEAQGDASTPAEEDEEDEQEQTGGGKAARGSRPKRRPHPYLQRSNSK